MFSLYRLEEIFQTLKQHKVRNILTGFGVSWGIFILVLLLGAGTSLKENIGKIFSGYSKSTIWVWSGTTSVATVSGKKGESIIFTEELIDDLRNYFEELEYISPIIDYGFRSSVEITYKDKTHNTELSGVYPEYFSIRTLKFEDGRSINNLDIETKRPTCVLGSDVVDVLFEGEDPIGKYVRMFDGWFKVVGVLAKGSQLNSNERMKTLIPFSSFQSIFNQGLGFRVFMLSVKSGESGVVFEKKLRTYLAKRLRFDKDDRKAVGSYNIEEDVKNFNLMFDGIQTFLWIIGICILLTGMVGISNMMLVVVKERTKEIGIRKAIGAKPRDILMMILSETVVITLLAGSVGLFLGLIGLKLANIIIANNTGDDFIFRNLNVNISVALTAVVILVFSGCLAGIVPARKATKIVPVEALNTEN